MKRWIMLIGLVILWFAVGFVYGGALLDSYRHLWGDKAPEPVPARLWTPANELPLPEIEQGTEIEIKPVSYIDHDGLDLDAHEIELIKYTNEYRVKCGRRPLKATRKLMGTARRQAWQQTRSGMRHGYTSGWRGENIAAGQSSPREAVNAWINSSGHRANMLGNFSSIGVGGYGNQWAQQFE